jgi:hypothetical protein
VEKRGERAFSFMKTSPDYAASHESTVLVYSSCNLFEKTNNLGKFSPNSVGTYIEYLLINVRNIIRLKHGDLITLDSRCQGWT